MSISRAAAFLSGCGYIGFVVTVKPDGTATGMTNPEGETVDNEAIQAAFMAADLPPETGRYTFELYSDGTRLVMAPSERACTLKERLEVQFDARITQPLLARLRAAAQSPLSTDAARRGDSGMHGEGMHGGLT